MAVRGLLGHKVKQAIIMMIQRHNISFCDEKIPTILSL
jgi:hypothetical protein